MTGIPLSGAPTRSPWTPSGPLRQTHGNAASRIGNTPLFRLCRIGSDLPRGVELWAKAEFFNPGGSVKDRTALGIVQWGQREGRFTPGKTLLDASSGNTGIAYAFLGAIWDFPVEIVLPRNAGAERLQRLEAYGATITFTDALEGTDGAQRRARELAGAHPDRYFYPDQYHNPANPAAHYETTGPEIWRDTCGIITHFVAGIGTGGTISGAGRYLKERSPSLKVLGVVPDGPLHGIEGLKHLPTSQRPGTLDLGVLDGQVPVSTEDAIAVARRLAREEGLYAGTSSGAAVHAALELARTLDRGVVVTILPDGGDRYRNPPEARRGPA